jgi:hypothetical protein
MSIYENFNNKHAIMKITKVMLVLTAGIVGVSCSLSRHSSKKISEAIVQAAAVHKDSARRDSINKLRPYKEVITDKAITSAGLIQVHKVDERYYFEIADSNFNRDLLIVNRISKAAAATRIATASGVIGYAGDYIGENVIRIEKGPNKKIFFRRSSYLEMARDSSENGMYRSVLNSNLLPIVASFDIRAHAPDSTAVVIDITDFLNTDNDVFGFNSDIKKLTALEGAVADRSYIQQIRSYPLNTEIKTVKTYLRLGAALTYELNSSIVSLPRMVMKPRYYDERVGYFARGYIDYDHPQFVKASYMVTRWRLEPKPEDIERYKRGELVEPVKPIIFYIDPATPKKWVPYLIKGVNAWQRSFEKAGFKNAIYAREVGKEDSTWSLDDARHNVIVYKASLVENASGPQVSDPRSGEILESHINWYHNVQQLLHDWYMVQAGPVDPAGRKMKFDDELMGRLIQYVCTHEVGHTLGLRHNFLASSTVPVDSLRSRSYVSKHGHTPSIMDYARFNFVAQPEDSIDTQDLVPRIGEYDDWAIEWAYRWLPSFASAEEEKAYLNHWVISKWKEGKQYWFGDYDDYDALMEDLGDNIVKANTYAVKNLSRMMINMVEWTKEPHENYESLVHMKDMAIFQYMSYIYNVTKYIGGIGYTPRTIEQGDGVKFISREKQKEVIRFFQENLFEAQDWFTSKEVFMHAGGGGVLQLQKLQEVVINLLVQPSVYRKLVLHESNLPRQQSYSFNELLTDLETGIWRKLRSHEKLDFSIRGVQKAYATRLIDFVRTQKRGSYGTLDACSIIQDHIERIHKLINQALPGYTDRESRLHLIDVRNRLKVAIDFAKEQMPEFESSIDVKRFALTGEIRNNVTVQELFSNQGIPLNCWRFSEFTTIFLPNDPKK